MRRTTVRLLRSSFAVTLFVGLLGIGPWGCIPSFRGMKTVSKDELKPKKKPSAAAEILFLDDFRKVWYGQIGQSSRMTFRRVYKRIRINSRKGFSAATVTLRGSHLLALKVRTTCPDGRVSTMGLSDVQRTTKGKSSHALWYWGSQIHKFTASGVGVGCIIDFFWEEDRRGSSHSQTWSLIKKWPIRKAHMRYEFKSLVTLRATLRNMDMMWGLIGAKRRAKEMAKAKKKKGDKKPAPARLLTEKEKQQHLRFTLNNNNREVDLWLTDIPAIPTGRAWGAYARNVRMSRQPRTLLKKPFCKISLVSSHGIDSAEHQVVWKNIDGSFTKSRSFLQEDRSGRQRSYQIDEQEELHAKNLPALARRLTQSAPKRADKMRVLYEHLRLRMKPSGRGIQSSNKLYKLYLLRRASNYETNMIYIVMLRSLGIRAYPALVAPGNRTYQDLAPSVPFSKVATYVAPASEGPWGGVCKERGKAKDFSSSKGDGYAGGRRVKGGRVLDPSSQYRPFGLLPSSYTNVWMYIVDGGGGRFFKTPASDPNRNRFKLDYTATLAKDGTISGTVKDMNWGTYAASLRSSFAGNPKRNWVKKRLGWWDAQRGCTTEAEIELVGTPNLDVKELKEPFVSVYKFKMKHCAVHGRHGIILRPWAISSFKSAFRAKVRLRPFDLGVPETNEFALALKLPAGYTLLNPSYRKAMAGLGMEGASKMQVKGGTLYIAAKVKHSRRLLPPAAYDKVKSFFKGFKALQLPIVIRNANLKGK